MHTYHDAQENQLEFLSPLVLVYWIHLLRPVYTGNWSIGVSLRAAVMQTFLSSLLQNRINPFNSPPFQKFLDLKRILIGLVNVESTRNILPRRKFQHSELIAQW